MKKPVPVVATLSFIALSFMASIVQAQVQVVDSVPQSSVVQSTSNQAAELFYQFQALQQEVMMLRGMVEEQAFEIKRLKQQRLDDYVDLDRRLSALSGAGSVGTSIVTTPAPINSPAVLSPVSSVRNTTQYASESESTLYNAAYSLLKKRQIDASINGFKEYIARFPTGEYASNSYYWLGEIYLLKSDLPAAEKWFGSLLREFPNSRKVPDAQFKLGKVYHLQGKSARALELLNIVVASNSDASRLAKQYISNNF